MRTRINVTFTAGTRSISTNIIDLSIPDIRLIVNETLKIVVASSMLKDNISSITNGVITYVNTIPVLVSGDQLTVEIDRGTNGNLPEQQLTAIEQRLDVVDSYTVNEYPATGSNSCLSMALDHCKAVYGEVFDTSAPNRYLATAKVRIKMSATDNDSNAELAMLRRNLVFGGSRINKSITDGTTTYTVEVPNTGYGFTELWLKTINGETVSYIHYCKSPGSGEQLIDNLHPALEDTSGQTPVYLTVILRNPSLNNN